MADNSMHPDYSLKARQLSLLPFQDIQDHDLNPVSPQIWVLICFIIVLYKIVDLIHILPESILKKDVFHDGWPQTKIPPPKKRKKTYPLVI